MKTHANVSELLSAGVSHLRRYFSPLHAIVDIGNTKGHAETATETNKLREIAWKQKEALFRVNRAFL